MKALLFSLAVSAVLTGTAFAQEDGPHRGTWVLNVEKSDMPQRESGSQSETVTYRYENGEEVYTAEAVTMDGKPERQEYRGTYDPPGEPGTLRMWLDGDLVQDVPLQLRRLDDRTHLRIAMQPDGSLSGIIVRRLSEDGKTLTSSILSFDNGKVVNRQTRVFEKQE